MRRVLIIGPAGAGKTTLALDLSHRTGLPVMHLDSVRFGPNWQAVDGDEIRRSIAKTALNEHWIMDGAGIGLFLQQLNRVDTLIYLDMPLWRCVGRYLWRAIRYFGRTRPELAPGCREMIKLRVVRAILMFNRQRRKRILSRLRGLSPETSVYRFASFDEVAYFLESIPNKQNPILPAR